MRDEESFCTVVGR